MIFRREAEAPPPFERREDSQAQAHRVTGDAARGEGTIVYVGPGDAVVWHPDHPSVRLRQGVWRQITIARSVVPRPRLGD